RLHGAARTRPVHLFLRRARTPVAWATAELGDGEHESRLGAHVDDQRVRKSLEQEPPKRVASVRGYRRARQRVLLVGEEHGFDLSQELTAEAAALAVVLRDSAFELAKSSGM